MIPLCSRSSRPLACLAGGLLALSVSAPAGAQTEKTLFQIAHTAIGSNGFGTSWRGQDIEIAEDAWVTRIAFQTGSASASVDEIRLMTAVPNAVTLRAMTSVTRTTSTEIEAVLTTPFMFRGGTRYTIWFHQSGNPLGTYGCDLTRVEPTWGGYHTNVDPTQAPGAGEPTYWWHYQYGTNMRLVGYDNLEITGNLTPGGSAQIQLEARPNDLALVVFAVRPADLPLPPLVGPLRVDPTAVLPVQLVGSVGPTGVWINALPIPPNPNLRGLVLYTQGLYDATFSTGGTFSPMDELRIQ